MKLKESWALNYVGPITQPRIFEYEEMSREDWGEAQAWIAGFDFAKNLLYPMTQNPEEMKRIGEEEVK